LTCSVPMASRHLSLVVLACVAAQEPAAESPDYTKLKLTSLKRMVFVRGESCADCKNKADWVTKASEVAGLPVQPELEMEWKSEQAYQTKLKNFNITRDEFIEQMNASESVMPLEGKRAERLWEAFQEQLQDGTVEFVEDGGVKFSMPITHKLAPYVHPAVVDALEAAFAGMRAVLMKLPKKRRVQLEALVDHAFDSGALHAAIALCLTLLAIDFSISYLRRDSSAPADAANDSPPATKTK